MKSKPRLAKLTRPFQGAAYARTRLFDLFDRAGNPPVLWISGPPGSGKTTLIADYTARRSIDCLWYQLDRGDADVASFFFYLTEAAGDRVNGPLPHFQPEYLGDIQAFSRNYFRDLFARLETPFLVFDNYQDVPADSRLHAVIRDALAEVPPGTRIAVVSRTNPPAAFASLRARGTLDLIGWNELRLTLEECEGLAAKRGVTLSHAELEQLQARTQGWAAGVVLLLSDMRAPALAHESNATPAVIFDYLADEIFQKFSPEEREFLLRACYLPQITNTLANQLGLSDSSRAMMRAVGWSEFLVSVRQVEPEPIYQLHPLLLEFLRARAEVSGTAEEIEGRKRLAAQLLIKHEHIEAAANLLIRLGDWPGLKRQITANADALLGQGRSQILEGWIRALPEAQRTGDPWLAYWLGVCRFPYAPREAREYFINAYRQFESGTPEDLRGLLAALHGTLEAILHDSDDYRVLDPWIETASRRIRAVTVWPPGDLEARLTSSLFLAIALRRPDHPELPYWSTKTQEVSQLQVDPNLRIGIDAILAALSAWHGQFTGALRLLEGMRELLQARDLSPVSAVKFAQTEATYYMLAGDAEKCQEAAHRGLRIVAQSGVRVWNETFLANGLWGALAGNNLDEAAEWLQRIESTPSVVRNFDSFMRSYGIAWHAMMRGDAFLAHQHLKSASQAAANLGQPGFQVFAGLALALVLLEGGDERSANRELENTCAMAAGITSRLVEFTIAMCRASFAQARGRDEETLHWLRVGLAIGRERGMTHFLWWIPQRMARLCQRALEAQIEPDYVKRLIERRRLMPNPPPYSISEWPWRFRIHALGRFRVEFGGTELREPGKRSSKQIELLKALVALGGRSVPLNKLAKALWPRKERDFSQRSLNTTLHRLRKLLREEALLVVEAGELRLNTSLVWLDTWGFERACEEALALLRRGTAPPGAPAVLDMLRGTLNFYGGCLLEDDAKDDWTVAPREHFRGLMLRVLSSAGPLLEKLGHSDDLIDAHRHLLEREPLADSAYRALMQVLKNAGRNPEAAEVYQRCRNTLEAELKISPSAATQELYRSLFPPGEAPE